MKKYSKDTIFTFITQFVVLGLSFATNILIARLLGPEGKGIITLASLFPFIVAMVLAFGLDEASVFVLGKEKRKHSAVLFNFLLVWIIMSIISIPLLYFLRTQIVTHLLKGFKPDYFNIIIFSVPFFLLLRYTMAAFQGHSDFQRFNKFFILQNALVLIFSVFFILKYKVIGGIISMFLAILVTSIICYLSLLKYGKPSSPDLKLFKNSLTYGLKAEPGVVLNFFNQRLDMFILNFFAGVTEVGIYSIAVILAELLNKIPEAFGTTLFPKIASLPHKPGNDFTSLIIRNVVFIMIAGSILLALVAKPLIFIAFGKQFLPSLAPFWILSPGVIFMGITKIICSNFHGQGKPEYGTYLTIVSVIFTIVLDILLIPQFKSVGAAIASTISYFVSALLSVMIFIRRGKVRIVDMFALRKGIFSEIKIIIEKE